jgi:ribonuclease BN (tRNA processing enzyme)
MRSVHTSDVEVGRLAVKSGVRRVLLSHIVRMGGTDAELLAGVRRGGYRGVVQIAQDLRAY